MATRCAWPPESSRGHRLLSETDALERGGDALCPLGLRAIVQSEADIVGDLEPGQEPRLLKNNADLLVRRGDALAVEHDRAFARRVESADGAQQGRFAAAGAADHGDDLAKLDLERDSAERMHAVGIGFADAFEHQHGTTHSVSRMRCSVKRCTADPKPFQCRRL